MKRTLIACAVTLLTAGAWGCSTDLGINDYQFGCEKDSDCGDGYACVAGQGCVSRFKLDAGHADAEGTSDAAGVDAGLDAGGDAGHDGGVKRDGGFLLRASTTLDSAAGAGSSHRYRLKSVTGLSAGPAGAGGGYRLLPGQAIAPTGGN